ncbi:hypothetical protein MA16_Dca021395 [Dendrobium catenatum]|uniref:Uncharacterized protein n=1 Tax=Dendrobium catenatum TaxID=906689 RepID=A0A2I0X785_9ASPA|nr:hypothetical protein MA16_Dca021395 [Dendrobium catenatum]
MLGCSRIEHIGGGGGITSGRTHEGMARLFQPPPKQKASLATFLSFLTPRQDSRKQSDSSPSLLFARPGSSRSPSVDPLL